MSNPNTKLANSEVTLAEAHHELDRLWHKHKHVEVTFRTGRQRTLTMNRALHLYLQILSEALNSAGLDMRRVLKPGVDVPWTMESCKEYLWRPVQEAVINKSSTTEADRTEYNKVYEVLDRHLGEKFGIHVEWPKKEDRVA